MGNALKAWARHQRLEHSQARIEALLARAERYKSGTY